MPLRRLCSLKRITKTLKRCAGSSDGHGHDSGESRKGRREDGPRATCGVLSRACSRVVGRVYKPARSPEKVGHGHGRARARSGVGSRGDRATGRRPRPNCCVHRLAIAGSGGACTAATSKSVAGSAGSNTKRVDGTAPHVTNLESATLHPCLLSPESCPCPCPCPCPIFSGDLAGLTTRPTTREHARETTPQLGRAPSCPCPCPCPCPSLFPQGLEDPPHTPITRTYPVLPPSKKAFVRRPSAICLLHGPRRPSGPEAGRLRACKLNKRAVGYPS